jgi:hypothetical protein
MVATEVMVRAPLPEWQKACEDKSGSIRQRAPPATRHVDYKLELTLPLTSPSSPVQSHCRRALAYSNVCHRASIRTDMSSDEKKNRYMKADNRCGLV